MKTVHTALTVLFAIAAITSTQLHALPMFASSVIYLDANDNIIGQQIRYCDNHSYHAGAIDPANAYRIEEEFGCGDPLMRCHPDPGGGYSCSRAGSNYEYDMYYFRSATGRSQAQYCHDATHVGGPFFAHPPCGMPAPSQISGFPYPYLSGWYP